MRKKLPSMDKKWIKDKCKVEAALADLQKNHNHSWYREILQRNDKNRESTAIFYRGNEISYQTLFDESIAFAKSLKALGIGKVNCFPSSRQIK